MRAVDLAQSRLEIHSIREGTTVHDAARDLRDPTVRPVSVHKDRAGMFEALVFPQG